MNNIEKVQEEQANWFILVALHASAPDELTDNLLSSYLNTLGIQFDVRQVRRALDYLESRKLISIRRGDHLPCWFAAIEHHGVDIVNYTVECYPGIARPPRFS